MQRQAALYREAARHVAEVMYEHDVVGERPQHKACCTAIYDVADGEAYDLKDKFDQFFRPENAGTFWFGRCESEANRPARVLALCFMAAMVEAGDA